MVAKDINGWEEGRGNKERKSKTREPYIVNKNVAVVSDVKGPEERKQSKERRKECNVKNKKMCEVQEHA